jgi:hypothetical protein
MGNQLFLAGGNAVSPAIYSLRDGSCQNDLKALGQRVNNNLPGSFSPRGSELYRIGNNIMVSGKPLYAHPKYQVYDEQVFNKALLARSSGRAVVWQNNQRLLCFKDDEPELEKKVLAAWNRPRTLAGKHVWEAPCKDSLAMAVGKNAVAVAKTSDVTVYDLQSGAVLWTQSLPSAPVPWGLAITARGGVVATLEGGAVVCLGKNP